MTDFSQFALGRKSPHPARRSMRMSFMAAFGADLPAPAATRDWTSGVKNRPLFENDELGLCTCCTIANNVIGVTEAAYGTNVAVADADVVKLYENFGYDPRAKLDASGQNPTDQGAVFEDVLAFVLKNGFKGHHLIGSVGIDPANTDNVKRAIDWFGVACFGAELPLAWQITTKWGLDGYSKADPRWKLGSFGGHEFCAQKYDAGGVWAYTWDEMVYLTWDAISVYCDEVDAPIWASWIKAGKAPSGLSLDTLQARMAQIKAA